MDDMLLSSLRESLWAVPRRWRSSKASPPDAVNAAFLRPEHTCSGTSDAFPRRDVPRLSAWAYCEPAYIFVMWIASLRFPCVADLDSCRPPFRTKPPVFLFRKRPPRTSPNPRCASEEWPHAWLQVSKLVAWVERRSS
eukprot:scaffold553_cov238-Pinguiococcus_pyrenoidosus.AAC.4